MMLSFPTGNDRLRSRMRNTLGSSLASCSSDQVKLPSTKPMRGSDPLTGARMMENLAVSCSCRKSSMRWSDTWAWRTFTSTAGMVVS